MPPDSGARPGAWTGPPTRFISRLAINSRITINIIRFERPPTLRFPLRSEGRPRPPIRRSGGRGLPVLAGVRFRVIMHYVPLVALEANTVTGSSRNLWDSGNPGRLHPERGFLRLPRDAFKATRTVALSRHRPPLSLVFSFWPCLQGSGNSRRMRSAFRVNHRV